MSPEQEADTVARDQRPRLCLATMYQTCGIAWLKSYFSLDPSADGYAAQSGGGTRLLSLGHPASAHFVYLDPPYWDVRPYYRHVLSEQQHRDLCRVFIALPCPAALSGYHSDLYAAELGACRRIEISTRTRRRNVTEVVWLNFPPPAVYHDTRFLGRDRRERIARRRRNWRRGLERMGTPERQAVLEACLQAASPPGGHADRLRTEVLWHLDEPAEVPAR